MSIVYSTASPALERWLVEERAQRLGNLADELFAPYLMWNATEDEGGPRICFRDDATGYLKEIIAFSAGNTRVWFKLRTPYYFKARDILGVEGTVHDTETTARDLLKAVRECVDIPLEDYVYQEFLAEYAHVNILRDKNFSLEKYTELYSGTSFTLGQKIAFAKNGYTFKETQPWEGAPEEWLRELINTPKDDVFSQYL